MGWDVINSAVTENAWDGKKVDYGGCFVYKVEYYLMQLDSQMLMYSATKTII